MRRSKKEILAGVMSLSLVIQGTGGGILLAEGKENETKTITAFEELDDTVLYQEVEYGTLKSQLKLPRRLKATILTGEDRTEEDIDSLSEIKKARTASPAEADRTASPSDAEKDDFDKEYENERIVSVPVRWELDEDFSVAEEYDGETAGIYVFDAVLKNEDRYELDAELPRIEVVVGKSMGDLAVQLLRQKIASNIVSGEGWILDLDEKTLTIDNDEGIQRWINGGNAEYRSDVKTLIIGDQITEVPDSAFNSTKSDFEILETVVLGKAVKKVGDRAFSGCDTLIEVQFNEALEEIGDSAFSGTGLKSIRINVKKIGFSAFHSCKQLENAEIGTAIEEVDTDAFYGCESLKEIRLEGDIKRVGDTVFGNCYALEYASITAEEIGSGVFFQCSNLKEVSIGWGMQSIGMAIFNGCTKLQEVWICGPIETIDYFFFANCNNLSILHLLGSNPPVIQAGAFDSVPKDMVIYTIIQTTDEYQKAFAESGLNFEVIGNAWCTHTAQSPYCSLHYDDTYHWKECERCGEILEKEAHYGGTATETERAVCEVCGVCYGELKPTEPEGPTEPEEPTESEKPTEPEEPTEPEDPTEPEKPTEPENPSEPENPTHNTSVPNRSKSDENRNTVTNHFTTGVNGEWFPVENRPMTWRFIRNDGTMLWNMWAYINNPYATDGQPSAGWFRFDWDGIMQYGWYLDEESGKWYYLHGVSDGMLGTMEEGWHYDAQEGNWYYLQPETGELLTGWQKIDGNWYYFNKDDQRPYGALYQNERTPDGYWVDESGVWRS